MNLIKSVEPRAHRGLPSRYLTFVRFEVVHQMPRTRQRPGQAEVAIRVDCYEQAICTSNG
jgi:hypothetical protein